MELSRRLGLCARRSSAADAKAKEFVSALYTNVPVLDTGARGATDRSPQRDVGDVLIAWENEAFLASDEFGATRFDIVMPSLSILAEPPVAVVDKVVDRKGTRAAAEAYLNVSLQHGGAGNHGAALLPADRSRGGEAAFAASFPKLELVTVDDAFGGWRNAQKNAFRRRGVFDEIYGQ